MINKKIYHYQNGATLLWVRDQRANYSAVRIGYNVGHRDNTQNGICHFVEHMMFGGTTTKSYDEIKGLKAKYKLNAGTGINSMTFFTYTSNRLIDETLDTIRDMLFNSTFDPKVVENERKIIEQEYLKCIDNDLKKINSQYMYHFYNDYLPNKRLGTKTDLAKITSNKLKLFVKEQFTSNKFVFCYVGNLSFGKVKKLCKKYFINYLSQEKSEHFKPIPVERNIIRKPELFIANFKQEQVGIKICCLYDEQPDDYKNIVIANIANQYLNRSKDGIFNTLRDNGLVYATSINQIDPMGNLMFEINAKTSLEKVNDIISKIVEFLTNLKNAPINESEFEVFKNRSLYDFDCTLMPNKSDRCFTRLLYYLKHGEYKKGLKFKQQLKIINSITKEDVEHHIKDVLLKNIHEPYITLFGDKEKIVKLKYSNLKKMFEKI